MGQGCCKPPPNDQWVGTWVSYNRYGRASTLIIWPNGCLDVTDVGPCSSQRHKCCTCYWRADGFGCDENCFAFRVASVSFEPEGSGKLSRAVLNDSEYIKIGPVPSPGAPMAHMPPPPAMVPPSAQYVTKPGTHEPQLSGGGQEGGAYPKLPVA